MYVNAVHITTREQITLQNEPESVPEDSFIFPYLDCCLSRVALEKILALLQYLCERVELFGTSLYIYFLSICPFIQFYLSPSHTLPHSEQFLDQSKKSLKNKCLKKQRLRDHRLIPAYIIQSGCKSATHCVLLN